MFKHQTYNEKLIAIRSDSQPEISGDGELAIDANLQAIRSNRGVFANHKPGVGTRTEHAREITNAVFETTGTILGSLTTH